jgi:hypothetical protein
VAGCCDFGDEPSGSWATELVRSSSLWSILSSSQHFFATIFLFL